MKKCNDFLQNGEKLYFDWLFCDGMDPSDKGRSIKYKGLLQNPEICNRPVLCLVVSVIPVRGRVLLPGAGLPAAAGRSYLLPTGRHLRNLLSRWCNMLPEIQLG